MEKTNIDIETLRIIYGKYRRNIIYIGVIIVCILVFALYTIPSLLSISGLSEQRRIEEEKLATMNKNLSFLRNTNEKTLENQLITVSKALPSSKDYEGILNAISFASNKSGVSLNDYEFQVGDVTADLGAASGFPSIELSISIRATRIQLINFLKAISETTPLSEVISVEQQLETANITTVFYYKAVAKDKISNEKELVSLSSKNIALIDTLLSWSVPSIQILQESSSQSASSF